MTLIQAIASSPRIVRTKFGEKTVLDCRLSNGEQITIWKEANNPQLMSIGNGERLMLQCIEQHKGGYKYEIQETSRTRAEAQRATQEVSPVVSGQTIPARPMGFSVNLPMEAERQLSRQIATVQKPAASPVVESSIEQTIDAQLDQYSSVFRMCLARAEMLSPSNAEALALEMFKGLASKLAG
jgi:hypothetical protein